MWPTTTTAASTSKSSAFHSPEDRLADARLRISVEPPIVPSGPLDQRRFHLSEQEIRKAAKAALKKADRFWRLAEKAPSENYREHHIKQAKDASTVSAEKTRQANEIRARGA